MGSHMKNNQNRLTEFRKVLLSSLDFSGSIQAKIFISFSVVLLLSISTICLILYFNFSKIVKDNAVAFVASTVNNANQNFEILFGDIEKISAALAINQSGIIEPLTSNIDQITYEGFRTTQKVQDLLSSMVAYKSYISHISVIGLDGIIFQTRGGPFFKTVLDERWFKEAIASKNKQIFFNVTGGGDVAYSRIIRKNNQTVGVVVIVLNKNFIEKLFNVNPVEGSLIFVADSMGSYIIKPKELLAPAVYESALSALTSSEYIQQPSHPLLDLAGNQYLVVTYHSSVTDWMIYGLIPYRHLMHEATSIRNKVFQFSGILLLITFVISIGISNQITKNLKRLHQTMNKVKNGFLKARPSISSRDEIGSLSEAFNLMMNNVQSLMEEIKTREEDKRHAELVALQSQIKPHFIYNTLGTIKNLASIQNVKNIDELIGSFIDLLRMTIGNLRETITIREEAHYLKSYGHIQKYKYLNKIIVIYHIENEVLDFLTIRLLLQPLVENAMIHGLGQSDKQLIITIRIYLESNGVKFEVTDNGVGMTKDKIAQSLGNSETSFISTGLGLRNVNERIQKTFGSAYGLTISSEPGMYTTVYFTIPVLKDGGA
jgi:two-component system sensor histidine kinase YesM